MFIYGEENKHCTNSVVEVVICAAGAEFLRFFAENFRFFSARQELSIAHVFMAQNWPERLGIWPEKNFRSHPSEWLKSTVFLSGSRSWHFLFSKKLSCIVLIEIRRLSMVSWSGDTWNGQEQDQKCNETQVSGLTRGGSEWVQGVLRSGFVRMVPGWSRSPKCAQLIALIEIRRLRMVSWSARTRNVPECLVKWDRWDVGVLTKGRSSMVQGVFTSPTSGDIQGRSWFVLIVKPCSIEVSRRDLSIEHVLVLRTILPPPSRPLTSVPLRALTPYLTYPGQLPPPVLLRTILMCSKHFLSMKLSPSTYLDESCRLAVFIAMKNVMFPSKSPNIWKFLVSWLKKLMKKKVHF